MIKQGVSLKTYNSLGVVANAALFAVVKSKEDLQLNFGDKRFRSAWILEVEAIQCFAMLQTTHHPHRYCWCQNY